MYIKVWFTDQNSKPLKIEDKINTTFVFNESVKYEKLIQYWKGYGFLSFAKNMGKNIRENIGKNVRSKYRPAMLAMRQKLLDHAKQCATDATKTSSED